MKPLKAAELTKNRTLDGEMPLYYIFKAWIINKWMGWN